MKIRFKTGLWLMAFAILMFVLYIAARADAHAADPINPDDFYFVIDGQKWEFGTVIDMSNKETRTIQVAPSDVMSADVDVEWVSFEEDVVKVERNQNRKYLATLTRKGPGYATVSAIITINNQIYNISCLVKVDLSINKSGEGFEELNTTHEKYLKMDVGSQKLLKLNNVKYPDDASITTGSAINVSTVEWESDNEGVVTVDKNGWVTAVGCGTATVTVTSTTNATGTINMSDSIKVVVTPTFDLVYYDRINKKNVTVRSSNDRNNFVPAENVDTSFTIKSKAKLATNLKWEVYDASTKTKLSPTGEKLNYYVSEINGDVIFENVKAGTYDIYAFANDNFNVNTKAPYAYIKIIVPVYLDDEDLVMNVGDTYDIMKNSNIPDFSIFTVSYGYGESQIAQVNDKGVITALSKGKATITLTYNNSSKLFDAGADNNKTIRVTVIDSIALSASEAVLYTRGSLLLQAVVTDRTVPIVWSSSDTSVATVKDGLVTAINPGIATITAQQTINGVIKKATCVITVRQSVTSITVNPSEVTIDIGEIKTLKATVSPELSGIKLIWKTSNENVVKITETTPLTVTIQGVSGGNAVISAINEDNIVVGYCHVTVTQPVTSIKLSDTSVRISLEAKSIQLRATVYPENATNKEVKWTSSNTQIARVNDNGLVTLVSPGEVTIIATSVDNPAVMALCNISIEIPVTGVALDEKEITMYVGQTRRLTYTVLPINASNNSVTWTSSNTNVASVDSAGKVTARQAGTTVIMVKTVDGSYTASCTVNVRQLAEGVNFKESELELVTGQVYKPEYTLVPANATDVNLVWESTDTKILVVDDEGKVTAKGPGVAFVIVKTETGAMSYIKVTVKQPVSGLILNFTEKTIYKNETFELKVSVKPSEASNQEVEWKSSNTKVATVSQKGEVTGVAVGTAIITCTTKDGGYSASCLVVVRERFTNMKLNYSEYRLSVGKSVNLSVVVDDQTITDQQFKWVSGNSDVATVNKNGKVTGKKVGTAIITAKALDGSGADASCEIEVVRPVTSIQLNKTYMVMYIGDKTKLKATVKPNNATYKNPEWKVIEGDAVMVDDDGEVTAVKEGSATIKASALDDSGKFALCQVVVSKRVPATSIILSDDRLVMATGKKKTIHPVLNPTNSTDDINWSSGNSAVADVDQNGTVTAKSTGTATITAMTSSGKKATTVVNVVGLNVTEQTLEQYDKYQLRVEGATSTVRWDSSDIRIATVDGNGLVVARGTGTATITATVDGVKLNCKITVTKIR